MYGHSNPTMYHQEIVDIVHETANLFPKSVPKVYREPVAAILECADIAREFNVQGEVEKACTTIDFCWALLAGVWDGVRGAVTDIIEHPLETAACVVAGEYILAYQLLRLTCDVAQIGITAYNNPQEGSCRWHEYIAPIEQCITAITNKEISLRDGVKGASQLAATFMTQRRLLGCLGTLYTGAKANALAYAKKYPQATPQQYVATPEGLVLKAMNNAQSANAIKSCKNNASKLDESLRWTHHGYKHVPPKNLSWGKIIKATKNGRSIYKPKVDIKKLELHAWQHGQKVKNGKNWKVFKSAEIIGANNGMETNYLRVECSANTIHGHPISELEYIGYLK